MRRLLLVPLLLAACEDAIVIEVHPAPGVPTTEVQLFVGLYTCDDCPGIQPPLTPEILPGDVYFREAANQQVRTAKVEGGVATFRIEPSESFARLELAVAVDANGESAALIQSIPLDTAGRYRVDLLRAGGKLGLKPATADGNFVTIWKQPNGPLPCMGFERWQSGALQGERIFIVPEDDLDCDGRTTNECAPYGYDAVGVPRLAETSCTTLTPLAMNLDVCKLGGATCDETTGTPRACAPSEYCLASAYCDAANLACALPQNRDICLFETEASPETVLECTIPFQPATDHDDVCGNGQLAKFNIRQTTGTANPIACIGPDQDFLLERPAPGRPLEFSDTIKRTSRDTANREWVVETRMHWEGGCNYKLEVHGEKAPMILEPDGEQTFAQFWVTQNGGGIRKVLVPIRLQYTNDCAQPAKCTLTLESENSLAKCLR
jgi:hypothetical protein